MGSRAFVNRSDLSRSSSPRQSGNVGLHHLQHGLGDALEFIASGFAHPSGKTRTRKIPRRETEIEHLPFAVAVRRQHGIGLACLQRADRALHQQRSFHGRAGLDQHGIGGELAFRRHQHAQLDLDVVGARSDAGSFGQVLRCRRNSATRLLAISAASVAGASKLSPVLSRACGGAAAGRRQIRRQPQQHLIFDRQIGLGRLVGRRGRRWVAVRSRGWRLGRGGVARAACFCGGAQVGGCADGGGALAAAGLSSREKSGCGVGVGSGFFSAAAGSQELAAVRQYPAASRFRPEFARRSPRRTDARRKTAKPASAATDAQSPMP